MTLQKEDTWNNSKEPSEYYFSKKQINMINQRVELPSDPQVRLAYERRKSGVGTGTFEVIDHHEMSNYGTESEWKDEFE